MKVIWEEGDIKAGRWFGTLTAKEKWMIGYRVTQDGMATTEWTVISLLDGMVNSLLHTRQDVADFLNNCGDLPLELIDDSWRRYIQ